MSDSPAYGLWSLAIINSLVFIIFAFSFAKPQNARDWRSFGAFSAFIVAFPILVLMYARLAVSEEREMLSRFGNAYTAYARKTPRFLPRFGARFAANP